MGDNTKIEWADATWNPVTGCHKVSPGCLNCYAERMAERFRGTAAFPHGFDLVHHPERMEEPLKLSGNKRVFVCSMSDLFQPSVATNFLEQVWRVMLMANGHTYLVLTKRPHVMRDRITYLRLPMRKHIWLGVSTENQKMADSRIPELLRIPAKVRFLSVEPMLEPIDLRAYLPHLQWVIVGGETGPAARRRPFDKAWAADVRDQCQAAGVPFFFKQSGGPRPGMGRGLVDGHGVERFHDAMPRR